MSSTIRAVLFAALAAATVAAAPLAAETPASCPPCAYYDNTLAPMRATLDHFRAELAEAEAALERARQQASEFTGTIFNNQVDPEFARAMAKPIEGLVAGREAQVDRWQRAVEAQERAVRDLEAARDACVRDQCRPTAAGGQPLGAVSWDRLQLSGEYLLDIPCPHCAPRRERLDELQSELGELEAEAARAKEAIDRAYETLNKVLDDAGRTIREGRARAGEGFYDPGREMLDIEVAADKVRAAEEEHGRALDALELQREKIEAAEAVLGACQQQSCAPTEKPAPADGPGFGMWIGVVGGLVTWDHPEEAVQSTLDNVTFPGAMKTATTDTEDTVPGFEIGLRWPLVRGRGFTLWADGGVTFYDEAELSGTARTEVTVGGTELLSVVQFDFMTGRVIVPRVDLRVATFAGFFFEGGVSWFDVPMELRIRDEFFVDGVPDEPITSVEEIDDSAFGFQAGFGWMGEHWELGVDYRQAEINDADLELVTARIRVSF
jgi:hypothetical protein